LLHEEKFIQGVHLNFWPSWLDFWRGDLKSVEEQLGSREAIVQCYGGLTRKDWLEIYRENIVNARQTNAKYFVFHVSHTRTSEVFDWEFRANSEDVIDATIQLVNELAPEIPEDTMLLFENLWWPGLTLLDKRLVAKLINNVNHNNVGIMLDTGHLMNTNQQLKSQEEAVDYVINIVENLGEYRKLIKGVHLHYSLSGEYVLNRIKKAICTKPTSGEIMEHILKIDQHLPFTTPKVKRIIEYIQPEFLVHEFMQSTREDWQNKLNMQKQALK
jgi:sugar phosphate isomerase/epimerase